MLKLSCRMQTALAAILTAGTFGQPAQSASPRSVSEVAQPCTAVTQEDIRKLGTSSVTEALKGLPTSSPPASCPQPQPLSAFDRSILDAHNAERASVGVPPLRWNSELAQHAGEYARHLAETGDLVYAPREGRGAERENLLRAVIGWTPERIVDGWVEEKSDFMPGLFPDVARDGNWLHVAHYTQLIWAATTDVGCGMARGGGFDWFVCRYSPGGNKDGKPVGVSTGQH
jgi:hypothetical protein